jgi:threonine/homoserine/homoserine lactone efflux protein
LRSNAGGKPAPRIRVRAIASVGPRGQQESGGAPHGAALLIAHTTLAAGHLMDFIPDLATLAAFTAAALFLAITPGPDMTLFISRALSDGRAAGFACIAGACTGVAIHTTLVAVGLSALIVASPSAFLALKIVGAGYLLWLAIQALRHGSAITIKTPTGRRRSLYTNWAMGLGVNLLNPKIVLFFMTFLPQFVTASDPNVMGKLFFLGLSFIVITLPVGVGIVLVADRLAVWLQENKRIMRGIDYGFAGIFSAFAVRILFTQGR